MSDNLTVFGTDYTGVTGIKAKGTGNFRQFHINLLTYIILMLQLANLVKGTVVR